MYNRQVVTVNTRVLFYQKLRTGLVKGSWISTYQKTARSIHCAMWKKIYNPGEDRNDLRKKELSEFEKFEMHPLEKPRKW